MKPAYYASLFLLGLGLAACNDQKMEAPGTSLLKQSASATGYDAYDFPYSPKQYVSKEIQIETPKDSTERSERIRDEVNDELEPTKLDPEEPEGGYTTLNYAYLTSFANTFNAASARPSTYTFVSSDGVGMTNYTPVFSFPYPTKYATYPNFIYDIQIAKSSSAGVPAKQGYNKLNLDLNRGAGGKYIYLTFSRTQAEYSEYGQDTYPGYMRYVNPNLTGDQLHLGMKPLNNITARSYRVTPSASFPPANFTDVYQFIPQFSGPYWFKYYKVDLNDGAGGRYIRPYKSRNDNNYAPIREVGVVAGNSPNIYPPSGWLRDNTDLNEGAGGDYIYFCYKR